ncbi:hypothetical protein QYM36_018625 [Artemia franciscana]|uniref:Uncharacterized protein n=1 Tax=Artemia franciscana TaxID=6661 RepID=A0AA88H945_ARTSF|nr:hypothetical protein QYM36_018625 [Artemia franciscana]
MGDFNLPKLKWTSTESSNHPFVELIQDPFLKQHVAKSTRYREVAESVDEKMAILKDVIGRPLDSATNWKEKLAPKTFPRLDSKIKRLINRKSRKFKKWKKTGLISDNEECRGEKFSSKFFKKDNKSN